MGRRPFSGLGFFVSLGPFLYFFCFVSFLFSDFYFSHIFFKFGPIDSNKLVNFFEIQNNTVRQ
jgi:hypothetical protein